MASLSVCAVAGEMPAHALEGEAILRMMGGSRLLTYQIIKSSKRILDFYMKLKENGGLLTFASHTQYGLEGEAIMYAEKVSRLFSFASPQTKPLLPGYVEREACVKMFLDSGAFSVFTKGLVLSLDEYCAFIEESRMVWDVWFNLDVIPGAPDKPATPTEAIASAKQGLENWRVMRARGLTSIPTFHMGEPLVVLTDMLAETLAEQPELPYLAIGGLAMVTPSVRFTWLRDTVWPLLVNSDGTPKIKVHGLAITDQLSLTSFPWASVDSSSWIRWVIAGRMAYWQDGVLKSTPVSERHRKGWHHFSQGEKDELRSIGEFPADFDSWPIKQQYLYITLLNVRAVKQLEAMIPAKLAQNGQPRRRMF